MEQVTLQHTKELPQTDSMLAMWSGGIDSTYELAKYLIETKKKVFAHHIFLKNVESRHAAEARAISGLKDKLTKIRPFNYTWNLIDDSAMPTMVYDMARVCFEAGAVYKGFYFYPQAPIRIAEWTIGTHKKEGHNWKRWEFIKHATKAAYWTDPDLIGHEMPDIEFKLPEMATKREEIEYLKAHGLFEDCWFCRWPTYSEVDKKFVECKECPTCNEVKLALEE